jgi:hypothetical protein
VSPRHLPVLARVSSLASQARGRRWPPAVDQLLIGWPVFSRTASAAAAADSRARPVSAAGRFLARAPRKLGRPGAVQPGFGQIWPVLMFFLENHLTFCLGSASLQNS